MTKLTELNELILKAIQKMILDGLTTLGPFFTALMPASFTFIAVHDVFTYKGETVSLILAILAALSIESVGIVTSHRAVDMYNAADKGLVQPIKFKISLVLIPVYVLSVVGIMLFAREFFDSLSLAIGIASPFMTLAVYVAMALGRDADGLEIKIAKQEANQAAFDTAALVRKHEIEDEERHEKQENVRIDAERKHELELIVTSQPSVQKVSQKTSHGTSSVNVSSKSLEILKEDIIAELKQEKPNLTQLASRLDIGRSTLYRHLGTLAGTGDVVKNGNGYELPTKHK